MPRSSSSGRMAEKRELAAKIATASAARSPSDQLARLNDKLGDGVGAVRERTRLRDMIDAGFGQTPMGDLPKNWRSSQKKKSKEKAKTRDTSIKVKAKDRRKKERGGKSDS